MSQSNADGPKHEDMQPEMQRPALESRSAQTDHGGTAAGAGYGVGSGGRSSIARGASYSAPPGASTSTPAPVQTGNSWKKISIVAAVVVGIAAGGWFGVSHFAGSGSGGLVPGVTQKLVKTFSVAQADRDTKATDQLKSIFAAGGSADKDTLDSLKAVNAPILASLAKSSPQTAQDIQTGRKVMYRVYLLDFLEEDGDHVEMTVDGVSYGDLYLRNAGTSFLIPLAPGKPADVKLTATADGGGGGVTVGFISSLGESRTDILQVGQSEQWQVIVQ